MRTPPIHALLALSAAVCASAQSMTNGTAVPAYLPPMGTGVPYPWPGRNSTNMTSTTGPTGGGVARPPKTEMTSEPCPEPATGAASLVELQFGGVTFLAWVGYMLGGAL